MLVGARVPHDPHGPDRQEHAERLPNVAVEPGSLNLAHEDVVRFSQDIEALSCHLPENADRKARARKRLAEQELVVEAKLTAELTHFVLEELAQRLHELELQMLGKSAHIVMALDDVGRSFDRDALDDVRIEGPLHEETGIGDRGRFFGEDIDELASDDLAFLLRIDDPVELSEETIGGVDGDDFERQLLRETLHHLGSFVFSKHAVIYEDAGQLVADRPVCKRRRD